MPKIGESSKGVPLNPPPALVPYWATSDGETIKLYHGNVFNILPQLPSRSVHCVVTSPPYWGLRDYGTGEWEGGDSKCNHRRVSQDQLEIAIKTSTLGPNRDGVSGQKNTGNPHKGWAGGICGKCRATRKDQQIGSEPIPDCETKGQAQCGKCFICSMVRVFREIKRILRNDGTLWLNLGDTYNSNSENRNGMTGTLDKGRQQEFRKKLHGHKHEEYTTDNLRKGNLIGIPWRVALALQYDRWILRGDNIWAKPNPMPESVTNRCTKAHEYMFLFTKTDDYYFDMEAIKQGFADKRMGNPGRYKSGLKTLQTPMGIHGKGVTGNGWNEGGETTGANKRSIWSIESETSLIEWLAENNPEVLNQYLQESTHKKDVWSIASYAYPGAHFATFPPKLVLPCILAGTSEKGCCSECGKPWERVVSEAKGGTKGTSWVNHDNDSTVGRNVTPNNPGVNYKSYKPGQTIGWQATCNCHSELEPIPCTVLDPFIGSGTTCCVSLVNQRYSIGIELSDKYLTNNAIPRITSELNERIFTRHLIPK